MHFFSLAFWSKSSTYFVCLVSSPFFLGTLVDDWFWFLYFIYFQHVDLEENGKVWPMVVFFFAFAHRICWIWESHLTCVSRKSKILLSINFHLLIIFIIWPLFLCCEFSDFFLFSSLFFSFGFFHLILRLWLILEWIELYFSPIRVWDNVHSLKALVMTICSWCYQELLFSKTCSDRYNSDFLGDKVILMSRW